MLKEMIPKLMKHIIIKVTEIFGVFRFIPLLFIIFSCEKTPLSSENEFGSIQFLIMINNNDNTSMSPSQPSVWSKLRTVSTVQISLSGPQSTEVTLQLSGKSVSHTIDDLKEGSYNASDGNLKVIDKAKIIQKLSKNCKIKITKSNDIRSYRLSSKKLIKTGFKFKHQLVPSLKEMFDMFKNNEIKDLPNFYSLKWLSEFRNKN